MSLGAKLNRDPGSKRSNLRVNSSLFASSALGRELCKDSMLVPSRNFEFGCPVNPVGSDVISNLVSLLEFPVGGNSGGPSCEPNAGLESGAWWSSWAPAALLRAKAASETIAKLVVDFELCGCMAAMLTRATQRDNTNAIKMHAPLGHLIGCPK